MLPEIKIAEIISGKLYPLLFLSFYDLKKKYCSNVNIIRKARKENIFAIRDNFVV